MVTVTRCPDILATRRAADGSLNKPQNVVDCGRGEVEGGGQKVQEQDQVQVCHVKRYKWAESQEVQAAQCDSAEHMDECNILFSYIIIIIIAVQWTRPHTHSHTHTHALRGLSIHTSGQF